MSEQLENANAELEDDAIEDDGDLGDGAKSTDSGDSMSGRYLVE